MLILLFEMSSVLVRNFQLDELEVEVNQLIYVSYIPQLRDVVGANSQETQSRQEHLDFAF